MISNCSSPITQTDSYRQLPNGNTRLSEILYNTSQLATDDKEYDLWSLIGRCAILEPPYSRNNDIICFPNEWDSQSAFFCNCLRLE